MTDHPTPDSPTPTGRDDIPPAPIIGPAGPAARFHRELHYLTADELRDMADDLDEANGCCPDREWTVGVLVPTPVAEPTMARRTGRHEHPLFGRRGLRRETAA